MLTGFTYIKERAGRKTLEKFTHHQVDHHFYPCPQFLSPSSFLILIPVYSLFPSRIPVIRPFCNSFSLALGFTCHSHSVLFTLLHGIAVNRKQSTFNWATSSELGTSVRQKRFRTAPTNPSGSNNALRVLEQDPQALSTSPKRFMAPSTLYRI